MASPQTLVNLPRLPVWNSKLTHCAILAIKSRPPIALTQHRFTGSPLFHANGTGYSNQPSPYAGIPNPEIDKAWQDLIGHRYFAITPLEAEQMFGSGFEQYKLQGYDFEYAAGVDVLHQLHCLNTLRKYADLDYYQEELREEHGYTRLHIGISHTLPGTLNLGESCAD
jgi:hypothetical protein